MSGKTGCIIILFIWSTLAYSQEDAWVYFKDKPDAAFYFQNPAKMLSQRALSRRAVQHIELDYLDVPLFPVYMQQINATQGITVMAKSKWLNALHIRGSTEHINALTQLPFVAKVEFANRQINNPAGRLSDNGRLTVVNKPMETAADFTYGAAANQIEMLNGHLLHQQDYTGSGKIIAIMDSGFPGIDTLPAFSRIKNNNAILGGYDFVGRSPYFYKGGTHGTLVLSTIAGYIDGQFTGTAPGASYYLFITEDTETEGPLEESLWVEAAEVADSLGVDVINTSLGYFLYDNPAYSHTYEDITGDKAFITRGANAAFTRGMICVTSAGNTGATENPHIGVPADAITSLTVGAVNTEEVITNFSSVGPLFTGGIKPDVAALGAFSTVVTPVGTIGAASGTSFSSPITAGLVACLWQALPQLTNAEILQVIRESADRFTQPDFQYGYGIPDFSMALEKGIKLASQKTDRFILYPNPVRDNVMLNFPKGVIEARLLFYNVLVQVVVEQLVTSAIPMLSLETLAAGIYNYRVESKQNPQKGVLIKE